MAITIRCKDGKVYEMPAELIASYRHLHPTADDELAKMVIWLEMNRSYVAASELGAKRFIKNWFKKVKEKQPQQQRRALMADLLTGRANGDNYRPSGNDYRSSENIIDITPIQRKVG